MKSEFDKGAHSTKWIAVKYLSVVWAASQRTFDPKHSRAIATEFDPDMFGILSVTLPNGDGIYHVIDGQHRKDAVQQLFGDEEKVPCNIFDATDPARAAEIFDRINTGRKSPSPIDRFKIRVTAKNVVESSVAHIVRNHGFKIASGSERGTISAVSALVAVHKRFGSVALGKTLDMIHQTWGDDRHAYDAPLLRGFAAFLAEYRGHIKDERLIRVVQKDVSPGRLLGMAKTLREANRVSLADGVKLALVQLYDHHNRGQRLAELQPRKRRTVPAHDDEAAA